VKSFPPSGGASGKVGFRIALAPSSGNGKVVREPQGGMANGRLSTIWVLHGSRPSFARKLVKGETLAALLARRVVHDLGVVALRSGHRLAEPWLHKAAPVYNPAAMFQRLPILGTASSAMHRFLNHHHGSN
jgi:hypothetical protein